MSLKDDLQQNIQIELDFSSALTGEAREAGREETESSVAMNGIENPASTNRLMEAVCERENLTAALRQVKANKDSPGVDGMTVGGIKDYGFRPWRSAHQAVAQAQAGRGQAAAETHPGILECRGDGNGLVSPSVEGTPQGGPMTPRTQKVTSSLNGGWNFGGNRGGVGESV